MKRLAHIHLAGGAHASDLFAGSTITDLHPAAANLKRLAEKGMVHAVLCTGPKNPNGSHFVMTRVCQDRNNDTEALTGEGWGDAALAATFTTEPGILGVHVGEAVLPRTLQGGKAGCIALARNITGPDASEVAGYVDAAQSAGDLPDHWRDKYIANLAIAAEAGGYSLGFGSTGKTMAEVLAERPSVRFVSGVSPGFDTHNGHKAQFAWALGRADTEIGELAAAAGWLPRPNGDGEPEVMPVLDTDSDPDDDIILLVTTEFSRDLIQTGADGYSHGRGGFAIVIGRNVRGGFTGSLPKMGDPRLLQSRFLPVEIETPRVVLAVLDKAGWNTEGLFTRAYEPLTDVFVAAEEPAPAEPDELPVEEPPEEPPVEKPVEPETPPEAPAEPPVEQPPVAEPPAEEPPMEQPPVEPPAGEPNEPSEPEPDRVLDLLADIRELLDKLDEVFGRSKPASGNNGRGSGAAKDPKPPKPAKASPKP